MWVVQVLDANEEYLEAIGAIGPVIAPVDDEPTPTGTDPDPHAVAIRSRKTSTARPPGFWHTGRTKERRWSTR